MSQSSQLAELNDSLTEQLDTANQRIVYLEDCLNESREALETTVKAKEDEIHNFQVR